MVVVFVGSVDELATDFGRRFAFAYIRTCKGGKEDSLPVYYCITVPPIPFPFPFPLPPSPYLRFGRLCRLCEKSAMSWCGCKVVSVDIESRR